jgi:hypothetical protein
MLKILSTYDLLEFVLVAMQHSLEALGIPAKVVHHVDDLNDTFIICTVADPGVPIPPKYIAYNFEQLQAHDHMKGHLNNYSPGFVERLRGAQQIWDYSQANVDLLRNKYGLTAHHLPVGYCKSMERGMDFSTRVPRELREYDFALIGAWLPFERRMAFTSKLIEQYANAGKSDKLFFGDQHRRVFKDDELLNILRKSKALINVHVYEVGNVLESIRLILCIICKTYVLTETSYCNTMDQEWTQMVDFITHETVEERLQHVLALPDDAFEEIVEARRKHLITNWSFVDIMKRSSINWAAFS